MGWVKKVEPGHQCDYPVNELATVVSTENGGYKLVGLLEGSVWVCEECQTIWVVVPGDPDSYASYDFTQLTPHLRKRYKL